MAPGAVTAGVAAVTLGAKPAWDGIRHSADSRVLRLCFSVSRFPFVFEVARSLEHFVVDMLQFTLWHSFELAQLCSVRVGFTSRRRHMREFDSPASDAVFTGPARLSSSLFLSRVGVSTWVPDLFHLESSLSWRKTMKAALMPFGVWMQSNSPSSSVLYVACHGRGCSDFFNVLAVSGWHDRGFLFYFR